MQAPNRATDYTRLMLSHGEQGENEMTKKPRRARKSQSGFTLIEFLVVVLIVGILAAIAIPQYFAVIERGHLTEATACVATLKSALEEARLANASGQYPAVADVTALAPTPLSRNCRGMKYFGPAGSNIAGGLTSYTVTLTRNILSFSNASGAPASYTLTMTHNDGAADAFAGTAPTTWLPN